jgi:hypothetical protein
MIQRWRSSPPKAAQISILAEARNWPLDHLEGEAATDLGGFDVVVVMNDVTYCAVDVLELLYQRVVQDADMVCALDFTRYLWVESRPCASFPNRVDDRAD